MKQLNGCIYIPGDKSISHRAIILNCVASGKAQITNLLESEDVFATINCLRRLGANIYQDGKNYVVEGNGLDGLKKSAEPLNALNSGTTARLLAGLTANFDFVTTFVGDASLSKRPMQRISVPLEMMGAEVTLTNNNYLPLIVRGGNLKSINYQMPVSSAQVKSAIILASLNCEGETTIIETDKSRNHTELMLKYLGADIKTEGNIIKIKGKRDLISKDIVVPGDISSAAFFIVCALLLEDSDIVIKDCGINPTRTGIFTVLDQMGANYQICNKKTLNNELIADIRVQYTKQLKAFTISGDLVPKLIDEIPILALLATQIDGVSIIKDAEELKVKETNRIDKTVSELTKLGGNLCATNDGMIINGKSKLSKADVNSYHDHRISMMLKIARLLIDENFIISGSDCDKISFPNFEILLKKHCK